MASPAMSQAQIRELERLIRPGFSLTRKNDVTLLALAEHGYAEYKSRRWHPTEEGEKAMCASVGDGV